MMSVQELIEKTKDDEKVWDIYAKGCTMEINQMAQDASKMSMMKYKARNVAELSMYTAKNNWRLSARVDRL